MMANDGPSPAWLVLTWRLPSGSSTPRVTLWRSLRRLGAAVHFLDAGGIPVPEAKGVETLLKGAREKAKDDDALLAEALRIFDLLYTGYAPATATRN
jgi:hypothetical protein